MTNLMSKILLTFGGDIPTRGNAKERDYCMRPEILRLCSLLIMTSICRACEALPFQHCWANSTLWKWAALPRALQQRDRKVRAFHTRQRPVHRLQPSQSETVCGIRFHPDTIRMNYCSRKCLKMAKTICNNRRSKKYCSNLPCCPQWQTACSLIWWTGGVMQPPEKKGLAV